MSNSCRRSPSSSAGPSESVSAIFIVECLCCLSDKRVYHHLTHHFALCLDFPGEPMGNYLIFKGLASSGHPLKIILPSTFPQMPPRIYFDMQMQQSQLMQLTYVDRQTMQIQCDTVKTWRSNYTLAQAITDTCTVLLMQPPGGQQPQQQPQVQQMGQQPWGNQQV